MSDTRMSEEEFIAWAKKIKLTDSQWMPVRFVVEREYDRGRHSEAASAGASERDEHRELIALRSFKDEVYAVVKNAEPLSRALAVPWFRERYARVLAAYGETLEEDTKR